MRKKVVQVTKRHADAELIERCLELTAEMTQEDAAAELGVSQKRISSWRKGDRTVLQDRTRNSLNAYRSRRARAGLEAAGLSDLPDVLGNRAWGLVGRMEDPESVRRAEGVLHYGDLAAGALEEARQKKYERNELITLLEWAVQKLKDSERTRVALHRAQRQSAATGGTTSSA